ncbi:hypothetical protein EGM97_00090 [Pseudomonas sp. AF32]|nr:hypothetical protein [Pseudomonas sp. AF32]
MDHDTAQATKTCGSEPARDDGLTFNIFVGCHTAIASRLAPTGDLPDARPIRSPAGAPAVVSRSRRRFPRWLAEWPADGFPQPDG